MKLNGYVNKTTEQQDCTEDSSTRNTVSQSFNLAIDSIGSYVNLDDLVFPVSPNALRLTWQRIMKATGIQDLHFHDLRHEAISRFFELGLTVPEVASISGHRDMRMLFRYAHANDKVIYSKLNKDRN